ncbi:hypothetical protein V1512DRAFT_262703 [Lipomyces arxii]|uniref:uncharacterized protein n=1 Tax=Lipomyces arxii TaxID=56418 RepID=UPI0034CEFFE8
MADQELFILEYFAHKFPTVLYDVAPNYDVSEIGIVFLIPGNPGLPKYYVPYMAYLRAQLPGWRMICTSQAGCDTSASAYAAPDTSTYAGLQEQATHKFDVLKAKLEQHGYFGPEGQAKQVVLIGHSIGCWLLQRLVSQVHKAQFQCSISLAILLFPTIRDIGQSPTGVKFTALLTRIPTLANIVANFVYYMTKHSPNAIVRAIVNVVMKFPPEHAIQATTALVSSGTVIYRCISLGKDEMLYIKDEPEDSQVFWGGHWTFLQQQKSKIVAFFAQKDHWVGDHTRAQILEAYADKDNVECILASPDDKCQHSFCVNESELMANYTARWINEKIQG